MFTLKFRLSRRKRTVLWAAIVAAFAICAVPLEKSVARLAEMRQEMDAHSYDWLLRQQGPDSAGIPEVVLVAIGDRTLDVLQKQGIPYPLPRSMHARLLRQLHADGAKVIGMDIIFGGESSSKEDVSLADALRACGNVVLASDSGYVGQEQDDSQPYRLFRDAARACAPVNLPIDALDGNCRRFSLLLPASATGDALRQNSPTFAPLLAALYLGQSPDQFIEKALGGHFGANRLRFAGDERSVFINFAGYAGDSLSSYDFVDVLAGKFPPDTFRDKIVLVGSTAALSHDFIPTPLAGPENKSYSLVARKPGTRPGVEIHAHIIHTLLSGRYFGALAEGELTALLYGSALGCALFTIWLRPLRALPFALLLAGGWLGASVVAFRQGLLVLPPHLFAALTYTYLLSILYCVWEDRRHARQVRQRFAGYIGPKVLAKVTNEEYLPGSRPERRIVTVLFSDLEGFTTLAERLEGELVFTLLNSYCARMADIVFRHGGTLDKFLGDGLLVYFNAPEAEEDHELRAVECALEMQQAQEVCNKVQAAEGLPPMRLRIGIHVGEVLIGDVGSEYQHNYTIIGDTVNMAARLQEMNKELGSEILISGEVQGVLPAHLSVRFVAEVSLRGKERGTRVYQVLREAIQE